MTMAFENPEVRIVGCGRWLYGDDQAGLRVVDMLRKESRLPRTCFHLTESPAADMALLLEGIRLLIVVDAAKPSSDHTAGSIQRLDYWKNRAQIRSRASHDTHSLGVAMALSLADGLGLLPSDVWIYAIGAQDCEGGEGVSESVAAAIKQVSRRIRLDVENWQKEHEPCHA